MTGLSRFTLILLAGVALSAPALSQDAPFDMTAVMAAQAEPPPLVVPPTAVDPAIVGQVAQPQGTEPDETALRYFARQGDDRRVQAEIARLQALYPDWVPPQNLLADDYTPDPLVERMWELFSQGDFAGTRAAIAEKQAEDPEWVPSPDLLESLRLGEAGQRLRNASDAEQYQLVVSIATETSALLTCDNVDLLWRLADAFIATDAISRGVDAYTYVLENCADPQARFTTLQQASERLAVDDLEPLLALERSTNGSGEFEPLRVDLARNAIAEVLAGRTMSVPADDVARLEAAVADSNDPDDLRLLGWYAESQGRPRDALPWFEQAMEVDPSALSANGLGTVLLQLERAVDAEEALADYFDASDTLTTTYLAAAASALAQEPRVEFDDDVLARIVERAVDFESAPVAQELGWYAYAFNQPATAVAWFEMALRYDPEDEPSAYGIVVASDLLGDDARVAEIQRLWGAQSTRIAQFGTAGATTSASGTTAAPVPPARPATIQSAPATTTTVATTAAPAQQVQATTVSTATTPIASAPTTVARAPSTSITVNYAGCSNYVPAASLSPDQALTRAWCLMDLLRPGEAVEAFGRALQSGSQATRVDASYGQALAYIRLGLAEHAAVAAAAAPQNSQRVIELQTSILTLTAVTAYQSGDYLRALLALDQRAAYAAEQNDLLVLRAYSYYFLGRLREAEQIFEAVAATGYRDAAVGLNTVRGEIASR